MKIRFIRSTAKRVGLVCVGLLMVGLSSVSFAEDQFFESDGVQIRFVDAGEGVPVLLVHGYTGDAEMWSFTGTAAVLAAQFRIIALDCRGHGQSGKPHTPESYGMAMADDVVRLMDRLEIDRAHIVGYSMGAEIALKLATSHPERVLSVVVGEL